MSRHTLRTVDMTAVREEIKCFNKHFIERFAFYGHAGPRTRPFRPAQTAANPSQSAADTAGAALTSTTDALAEVADATGTFSESDSDNELLIDWYRSTTRSAANTSGDTVESAAGSSSNDVIEPVSRAALSERLASDCSLPGEPVYLKFRSNLRINQDKADSYLVRKIREFGGNGSGEMPLVGGGDWSGGAARHHSPQRSALRMYKALVDRGVPMVLINEYKTSKVHSACGTELIKPRIISTPRPAPEDGRVQRLIECFGILECPDKKCQDAVEKLVEENRAKRLLREANGERLPVPPETQEPRRLFKGHNQHFLNNFERRNLPAHRSRDTYTLHNRKRTHDQLKPSDSTYRVFVNRDHDSGLSIIDIAKAWAAGLPRPEMYCPQKTSTEGSQPAKRKQPAKGKGKGKQPASAKRKYTCRTCGQQGHSSATCPKKPRDQDDVQPRPSKRRRFS
ncbi:hypothetical protein H4R21_002863 [Coemansia helicoidea]|uniref:Uncharacterized protein n=1 Tax=Coemansia helicoidea TaxID=1286919 RepID=A0ACC1L690_9FUNG|nr:hypothetical protein H4R21_002863 [Coemansia helicoidea]